MKKIRSLSLILVVFVVGISGVRAATCETSEMNRLRALANNVNASYGETAVKIPDDTYTPPDGLTDEVENEYELYGTLMEVSVTNLSEDLYFEISDTEHKTPRTFYYKDTDNGKMTFLNNDTSYINKYKIVIYANSGDCTGQKLRTIEVKTPMYNEYSETAICNAYPEYYLCYRYVDYELPNYETFNKRINDYATGKIAEEEKKKEEEKNKGFWNFVKENKVTITILTIVIVAAGVGTTVVIVVRKRRRVV